jgi:DUF1680 family protein
MLPTWMYARGLDSIYVNLLAGSTINVERVAGTDVQIVQATEYPWKGSVSLTVNPKAPKRFSLRIRVPNRGVSELYTRSPEANGIGAITVNGVAIKTVVEHGYAVVTRSWKAGDVVRFELPLKVQRVRANEKIAATRGKVALQYGPLVYNIEKVDQDITRSLAADAALTSEWKPDLLGGVVAITGTFADGSRLMAIPNFARYNRNPPPPPVPAPPATAPAQPGGQAVRPPPPPATSIIWMKEA